MINPVRYPGGKGAKNIVNRVLSLYPTGYFKDKVWIEPFCGGCGLGLSLLEHNQVSRCVFNDGDSRIAAMWYVIGYESERMIEDLKQAIPSIKLFYEAKSKANDDNSDMYEKGFYTYLLNRFCRSGYIDGGAIGGKEQTGKYKIDSRFNKERLIQHILKIQELVEKQKISFVGPDDAINFMEQYQNQSVFAYIDPPYYQKGKLCYKERVNHYKLASYLLDKSNNEWLLSYDDCKEIREMYDGCAFYDLFIDYSNNNSTRGKTRELLIRKKG